MYETDSVRISARPESTKTGSPPPGENPALDAPVQVTKFDRQMSEPPQQNVHDKDIQVTTLRRICAYLQLSYG